MGPTVTLRKSDPTHCLLMEIITIPLNGAEEVWTHTVRAHVWLTPSGGWRCKMSGIWNPRVPGCCYPSCLLRVKSLLRQLCWLCSVLADCGDIRPGNKWECLLLVCGMWTCKVYKYVCVCAYIYTVCYVGSYSVAAVMLVWIMRDIVMAYELSGSHSCWGEAVFKLELLKCYSIRFRPTRHPYSKISLLFSNCFHFHRVECCQWVHEVIQNCNKCEIHAENAKLFPPRVHPENVRSKTDEA